VRTIAAELLGMDYLAAPAEQRAEIEAAALNNARWILPPV
jgi:hypothetical protein